jgi:dienelactone hydrolase
MTSRRLLLSILLLSLSSLAVAAASKDVDLTAPDGTKLKATYYSAGKPGPGVLLFHQCNRDRTMWRDVAAKLAAEGLNVLTMDFRGFGESGGPRANEVPQQEAQRIVTELWPGDVDAAYKYLTSQSGVKKDLIGAGGASCGVNQSVQLARRHPEVKSLVLLSGGTTPDGRTFLKTAKDVPLFGSGSDDDNGVVEIMEWMLATSPNQGNKFQRYATGGHGVEMFAPHPELIDMIAKWYEQTLLKTPGRAPENKNAEFRKGNVLSRLDEPGGVEKVREQVKSGKVKISEAVVNQIGYERLAAGDNKTAIDLLKLNAEAYPNSANVYDSLSDAYLADGQRDLAKQNAQKAIDLLAADTSTPEDRKKAVRDSAEGKLKQLEAKKE